MAIHQIIYTSCMRGIEGVNDGQQVFSYDANFGDSKSDEIKSLFTYQTPDLKPGEVMTEEMATQMPSSFSFKSLSRDRCSITLSTYLGRDYMGSAGRFGNHLSHAIVCDDADLNLYPCELYGSDLLRSSMTYEEVNNPSAPDYLPEPVFTKGYVADIESVTSFLDEGDHMESLKQMLSAVLKYPESKKRIIICDSPENIIMWIAAIEYAFPLEIVKKINFSSYVYNPELSASRICGVVSEGSMYNVNSYIQSGRHYVFDFLADKYSDSDTDAKLLDFVDTTFSFSYESLKQFHEFVISQTKYREADEGYYSAYLVYYLFENGPSELSKEEFVAMSHFVDQYADNEIISRTSQVLIDNSDVINSVDNDYALAILKYLVGHIGSLKPTEMSRVKQIIVDKVLASLSDPDADEESFIKLYNELDSMAKSQKFSLASEFMNDENRNSILGILSAGSVSEWKTFVVVRIISDYVIDRQIHPDELYPENPIGRLYQGIFSSAYSQGRERGRGLIDNIIKDFSSSGEYIANMDLNMQGYILDLNLGSEELKYLAAKFDQTAISMGSDQIRMINSVFAESSRFDEMFNLYKAQISRTADFEEIRTLFKNTVSEYFARFPQYKTEVGAEIFETYFNQYADHLNELKDHNRFFEYAKEILDLSIKNDIHGDYLIQLMNGISSSIPFKRMGREEEELLEEMLDYLVKKAHKNADGRLLLLGIAKRLNAITSKAAFDPAILKIHEISGDKEAEINDLKDKEKEAFFELALENPMSCGLNSVDHARIFQLFSFTDSEQSEYMRFCGKECYKLSKGEKEYSAFAEFLTFMFKWGTKEDKENIGKMLSSLGKQKLDELKDEIKAHFMRDMSGLHDWEYVCNVAESTNPLFNNLAGLFKKK